jgi:cytochrome c5
MKYVGLTIVAALCLANAPAATEEAQGFPKEQVAAGAELYAVNCSPCHGARMQDAGAAFNLRKFPPDQHDRFINSVTRGKNQMPPWGVSSSRISSRRCGPTSWRASGNPDVLRWCRLASAAATRQERTIGIYESAETSCTATRISSGRFLALSFCLSWEQALTTVL